MARAAPGPPGRDRIAVNAEIRFPQFRLFDHGGAVALVVYRERIGVATRSAMSAGLMAGAVMLDCGYVHARHDPGIDDRLPAVRPPRPGTMRTDACRYFYGCKGCGTVLKPKAGDCCVYCC
jgi:hypothetical protein